MARMRVILVLLVALAAGGGLAYGTYNYVQNVPASAAPMPTRRSSSLPPISPSAPSSGRGPARHRLAGHVGAGRRVREARRARRPRPGHAGHPERADPADEARVEGGGRRPAAVIPAGHRAVSVRVNEVIGVAGYVLPGTRVDVVATASATDSKADMTSKVDADQRAGARGRHQDRTGRRAGQADAGERRHAARRSRTGRAADAREHRRQDSARAPQSARPGRRRPRRRPARRPARPAAGARQLATPARRRVARPAAVLLAAAPALEPATVEIIRGDKRPEEVVR